MSGNPTRSTRFMAVFNLVVALLLTLLLTGVYLRAGRVQSVLVVLLVIQLVSGLVLWRGEPSVALRIIGAALGVLAILIGFFLLPGF